MLSASHFPIDWLKTKTKKIAHVYIVSRDKHQAAGDINGEKNREEENQMWKFFLMHTLNSQNFIFVSVVSPTCYDVLKHL